MDARHRTAVLIACKNGEGTIGTSVRSAVNQADVFVVSDGSDDRDRRAGQSIRRARARSRTSGGKPARSARRERRLRARRQLRLHRDPRRRHDSRAGLRRQGDAPDGRRRAIAASSGRIDSVWDHTRRWNVLIAMRAFMYWSYQVTIKRGQNALRVVNVICGANTVFRANVFKQLIDEDAPYAIDDMYWLAEIVRRRLGRVRTSTTRSSWTIDPHHLSDWYRQTVRWSWGQFQSIRGHRLGVPILRAPGARLACGSPGSTSPISRCSSTGCRTCSSRSCLPPLAYFLSSWIDPFWFLAYYFGAELSLWITVAASHCANRGCSCSAPAIIVLDLFYRVAMLHAVVKTILRPQARASASGIRRSGSTSRSTEPRPRARVAHSTRRQQ